MINIVDVENKLREVYNNIDNIVFNNSKKVLDAFHKNNVSEVHFNSTSGYGYNDLGREVIENVYSTIFNTEDALVRNQFISGTHALTVALFGLLRPNDVMLSISGLPYDTLHEVIGLKENASSLKSFGVIYKQIDLIDNDFDYETIKNSLDNVKMVYIQRSKGYSTRKSISMDKIEKVIKLVKEIKKDIIVMVDNCYCEFVTTKEPTDVGADIMAGSLIKNLGGTIAPNGAYIVGKKDLIELASERLTVPGEGKEVGPTLGINKQLLQGLSFAPSVVGSALKTAVFASYLLEEKGYLVEPKYNEDRVDIVQNIIFNDKDKLIKFVQGIQKGSLIDAFALPMPSPMPGYDDEIIMASGSFNQGSSIELSCDGPLRSPYIAYLQGAMTYEYGKLGVLEAINNLER